MKALAVLARINGQSKMNNIEEKVLVAEIETKPETRNKLYVIKELFKYRYRYYIKACIASYV